MVADSPVAHRTKAAKAPKCSFATQKKAGKKALKAAKGDALSAACAGAKSVALGYLQSTSEL